MDEHRTDYGSDDARNEAGASDPNFEDKAKRKAKEAARETIEEIKVKGGQLIDRVRDVIEEGNARRIIIMKGDRVLMEFPLSAGIGGAAAAVWFAPHLAAIGAIASMVTDVHLMVERIEPTELPPPGRTPGTPPPHDLT